MTIQVMGNGLETTPRIEISSENRCGVTGRNLIQYVPANLSPELLFEVQAELACPASCWSSLVLDD